MLLIGSHVSYKAKEGLLGSVKEALSYNANSLMIYTGAPQNTKRDKIDKELTEKGWKLLEENKISRDNVIVHAPYIVNLANSDLKKRNFSIDFLKNEVKRVSELGLKYLVLHPGNYLELSKEEAIKNISDSLDKILKDSSVMILLETMAGKGTELGRTFEEIKEIIDCSLPSTREKLGVCIDSCHLSDSGYDISDFDNLLDEFDKVIGISKIKCVHLNDSKNIKGSSKDRHENIGFGTLGFDNLLNIIYDKRLEKVPKILETPYINEKAPYKEEIEMIKDKKFNHRLKEAFK